MIYAQTIRYREAFVPDRCRKARYRDASREFSVQIASVQADDAPVAIEIPAEDARLDLKPLYRCWASGLWVPATIRSTRCLESGEADRPMTFDDLYFSNSPGCDGVASIQEAMDRWARRYLLVDGVIHRPEPEPMYHVHDHWNSDKVYVWLTTHDNPGDCYNLLQFDQALADSKGRAEDGNKQLDAPSAPLARVLIPEAIRCDPQSDFANAEVERRRKDVDKHLAELRSTLGRARQSMEKLSRFEEAASFAAIYQAMLEALPDLSPAEPAEVA